MIARLFIALCLSPLLVMPAAAQQQRPKNPSAPPQAKPPPAGEKPPPPAEVKPPPPEKKNVERKLSPPKLIGQFDDWIAVELDEDGQRVCYTFTRVQTSSPTIANRGPVVMTITHRPSARNAVAVDAGFPFAAGAFVTVQADQTSAEFYTSQRAAFARDGAAAVAALQTAGRAIARSPGPRGEVVTDSFSLKGFPAAYAAIGTACPAR